jgi:hypothetical protein
MRKKKFTVMYKIDGAYTAEIAADTLEEALAKARELGANGLQGHPGDVLDEELTITGVYE